MEVLELARAGRMRARTERFALDDAASAYGALAAGRAAGRAVACPAGTGA